MRVNYDKTLDIATGTSRKTKTWKNGPILWSAILDRMSRVTRTAETMAEFNSYGRERQSEIKDTPGGFVGGYCNNGSRSDIRFRSILCLDADYADDQLWPDWKLLYGNAAAMYSTHKHTPENQRLRLIVPLSRNVTPDEYIAIGRRVADTLGIDKFDDTTYQPQRMMYWPSCSQDGQPFFAYTDGEFMNPDEILATYHNWQDVSSWPMSSRVAEISQRSATKQSDPLEKKGLVGAFCRAYYPIQDAIAKYIPAYTPCDEPNRYTYTEGSTAAGVVVYDDKWTHSFHATDPASGHLCNAWDLVRLHKFGHLDDGCDPDTAASSRPSYKAMTDLATEDKKVRAQMVDDDLAAAAEDFKDDPEDGESWKSRITVSTKGKESTIENIITILENDPALKNGIAFNELKQFAMIMKPLPWTKCKCPVQWGDNDDAELRRYIERNYKIASKDKIADAFSCVAHKNSFHPVRDYLDSCEWDGVPRLDTLFVDYMGAEDSEYTRAVTRKTMVGAVARAYNPGCKFDYILTLRGKQGKGKSSLIERLAVEWFSDSFTTADGNKAFEQLLGVWIIEIGELSAMKKSEVETVKHFITKRSDRFRMAYARRVQEYPRQCIFFATTNESQFLRDATGNRRWWVLDTPNTPSKDQWSELTPDMIKKIWGEAIHRYNEGEKLYLTPEMEAEARKVQEMYEEENPYVGIVADYLDRKLPKDWDDKDLYSRRTWLEGSEEGTEERKMVCAMEIWAEALGNSPDKFDRYRGKDVSDIMIKLPNWVRRADKRVVIKPYGQQRVYVRVVETT